MFKDFLFFFVVSNMIFVWYVLQSYNGREKKYILKNHINFGFHCTVFCMEKRSVWFNRAKINIEHLKKMFFKDSICIV